MSPTSRTVEGTHTSPDSELHERLADAAPRFGPALAALAARRGLAVTDPDDGSERPIPVAATPIVLAREELARRQRLAACLASAGLKVARATLAGERAELVLGGLSPLERTLAERMTRALDTLVTARVDFFSDAAGLRALELNATIPAMQGYSDIATDSFLETVGPTLGASPAQVSRWKTLCGSNAAALHAALLLGYERLRPGRRPERIALLCRRRDAQLTEQRWLRDRFRALGSEADVVHPDELSGDDALYAHGRRVDLVYRHVFVRRLEGDAVPGAAFVRALLAEPNGRRAVVLNPPATQVEVKLVFAMLSQALEDGALAAEARLTDDELRAVAEAVPWTRPFRGDALVDAVSAEPDRYVLKRSWDYGGRAVFVGLARDEATFADRVRQAYGEPLSWPALCRRAALDAAGGGFVVQALVDAKAEEHVLCEGPRVRRVPLYVDFSAYASVGLPESVPWGGVCRGSTSRVVNIVGGGGVLPLVDATVAADLLELAKKSPAPLPPSP